MQKSYFCRQKILDTGLRTASRLWQDFVQGDISAADGLKPSDVIFSYAEAEESAESENERVKQMPASKRSAALQVEEGRLRYVGTPEAAFAKAILAMYPLDVYEIEIVFRQKSMSAEEASAAE